MVLNPEKMEELKEKYGINEEAIFEIAESLEPDSEVPPFLPVEKTRGPYPAAPAAAGLPASLASAMRGDIGIGEAIVLMDYMDRKDDRRDRREQPTQDPSGITELIQEMREERKDFQDQMERLVLGKRADDAETRAKTAEQTLEEERAAQRQREAIEGAVRGAVDQIGEIYGSRLDSLGVRLQDLPENQQKGFWDELFGDFETDLKGQFKGMILDRLKAPDKPVLKTDEEGKTSLNLEGLLDRGEGILDKILRSRDGAPPKVPVKEVDTQPGGGPIPLSEEPAEPVEPIEAEYEVVEEEPPSESVVISSILPQDIDGIGPARAKELEEMGITDARQLTSISPSHLADELGISKEKADDIVKQAKDLIDQA